MTPRLNLFFLLIGFLLIVTSCNKRPDASTASDKRETTINDEIQFYNYSRNGYSYQWDFGDGTFSDEFSPKKSYTTPGDYNVTLTVYSKKKKKEASYTLPIRITSYSYPHLGVYAGLYYEQSSLCGSQVNSGNFQITGSMTNNQVTLYNFANRFFQVQGTFLNKNGYGRILPIQGIQAYDGSTWDMDTVHIFITGNQLIMSYQLTDSAYANTCFYLSGTCQASK
jgi:hypothetical protein